MRYLLPNNRPASCTKHHAGKKKQAGTKASQLSGRDLMLQRWKIRRKYFPKLLSNPEFLHPCPSPPVWNYAAGGSAGLQSCKQVQLGWRHEEKRYPS
jgi:hypothetical protein